MWEWVTSQTKKTMICEKNVSGKKSVDQQKSAKTAKADHVKRDSMGIAKSMDPVSLRSPCSLTTVETFRYWQIFCVLRDNST